MKSRMTCRPNAYCDLIRWSRLLGNATTGLVEFCTLSVFMQIRACLGDIEIDLGAF
jgi:hypothetical protein